MSNLSFLIKKKEVPYLCTEGNCLKTFEIPSELRTLSLIEKRLIALIQIFMTVIILPGGQMAEKRVNSEFANKCASYFKSTTRRY